MNPKNLILVGDHKQLRPMSMIPSSGTRHDRSLLERCVDASGSAHCLVEQYRMHQKICRLVSYQFYPDNMLQTPESVRDDRQRKEKNPIIWVSVQGTEVMRPKSTSFVNHEEIKVVQQVVTNLREKHPRATIAILTFYKGQLEELMRSTPASLEVEILTVDSSQGSEFDYVVLSTVRANGQKNVGFVADKQRINVAISRSLYGLIVVGDDETMSNDEDWLAVFRAASQSVAHDWLPTHPMPAAGSFETVMDHLMSLQVQKREKALAQQEVDAVKLMERQLSFRSKSPSKGKHPERLVNGAFGAKAKAVRSWASLPSVVSWNTSGQQPSSLQEGYADKVTRNLAAEENERHEAIRRDHELARSMQIEEDLPRLERIIVRLLDDHLEPSEHITKRQDSLIEHLDGIFKDIYGPCARLTGYGSRGEQFKQPYY